MSVDVIDLRNFYSQRLGVVARRLINRGIRARWPEVVATGSVADAGQVQAWAVGPGLGTGAAGRQVLAHVLAAGVPVVADADAITLLARHPEPTV